MKNIITIFILLLTSAAIADEVTYPKINQLKCTGSIISINPVTKEETVTGKVALTPFEFGSPGWYEGAIGKVEFLVAYEMQHYMLGSVVIKNTKIAGTMSVPLKINETKFPAYLSFTTQNAKYALNCEI